MSLANIILGLLYDRKAGYFSLRELAAASGKTPAAVKAALSLLAQQGLELEESPAHGIRLAHPVALNSFLIERNLGTTRVGRNVICFGEVASTNDVAMDSARQAGSDGLVVLADAQRLGRGRLGRRWLSPARANILMSVLLVERGPGLPHEALTIAAGLAVAEGIEHACKLACQLKWPNDVLLDGQKVSGILVELGSGSGGRAVVIGIGVNVNAAPPRDQVDQPAVSLADRLGESVDRMEVIRSILRRMDRRLELLADGQLDELRGEWLRRCSMINQRLAVRSAGKRYTGRVLDVSPLEGLILLDDHGRRIHLPAASSSIET
ncbi:MAG: biotin--[acetyl-CoA-carboxylase] ligase [Phycisphaerae bacterium]|jgi:BirA family biotin operon repressor/biotin-[acetyl-CoA-carboxylase] ligase